MFSFNLHLHAKPIYSGNKYLLNMYCGPATIFRALFWEYKNEQTRELLAFIELTLQQQMRKEKLKKVCEAMEKNKTGKGTDCDRDVSCSVGWGSWPRKLFE